MLISRNASRSIFIRYSVYVCLWLGCRVKWASIWSRPISIFLGIIYVHPIGAVCLLRGSFCRRRVSAGVIDFTRLWLYCFGFILLTPFWPGPAVALVSVLYFRFTSVWNGFRDIVLGQVKGTQRPFEVLGFEIPLSTNLKMSLKPRPVPGLQDPNKGFYPLKRNPEIIILGRYKDVG